MECSCQNMTTITLSQVCQTVCPQFGLLAFMTCEKSFWPTTHACTIATCPFFTNMTFVPIDTRLRIQNLAVNTRRIILIGSQACSFQALSRCISTSSRDGFLRSSCRWKSSCLRLLLISFLTCLWCFLALFST